MRALLALAALLLGLLPALAAEPEEIAIPLGGGETLKGTLYRPNGAGPFPAVVALHGCGGLRDPDGQLNLRHSDWGERLAASGFVVLLPDSFGSRGLGSQCRVREGQVRPSRERVQDALAAKAYLQTRPDVKPGSVSLMGWSNGASTLLYTVAGGRGSLNSGPDFAKAVAFYPGCRVPAQSGRWTPRMPLLILIGEADDWTPAAPCETLAAEAKAKGLPVDIVLYPGAYHDFDHPNLKVRERNGLAYTGGSTGTAHAGTNPAARADALSRVPAFLAR